MNEHPSDIEPPREDPRLPRVERTDDEFHVEEGGELWAVSYADFLMVLLSFFVIFYSSDKNNQSVLERVVAFSLNEKGSSSGPLKGEEQPNLKKRIYAPTESEFGSESTTIGKQFTDVLHREQSKGDNKNRLPSSTHHAGQESGVPLVNQLQAIGVGVEFRDKAQKVVIHLPDDIYWSGQTLLKPKAQKSYEEVLEKLRPFKDHISLTLLGHTDDQPVVRSRSELLSNNFDLSSLRATKAVQTAVRFGFPPTHLAAKGAAEFERPTRSLSIIVEEVKK